MVDHYANRFKSSFDIQSKLFATFDYDQHFWVFSDIVFFLNFSFIEIQKSSNVIVLFSHSIVLKCRKNHDQTCSFLNWTVFSNWNAWTLKHRWNVLSINWKRLEFSSWTQKVSWIYFWRLFLTWKLRKLLC